MRIWHQVATDEWQARTASGGILHIVHWLSARDGEVFALDLDGNHLGRRPTLRQAQELAQGWR